MLFPHRRRYCAFRLLSSTAFGRPTVADRLLLLLLTLLLVLLTLLAGCSRTSGGAGTSTGDSAAAVGSTTDTTHQDAPAAASHGASVSVAATVAVVTLENFQEALDAMGVVAPRPGHVAALSAAAPSRITAVRAAIGERVRKGAVLVVFDEAVFDAAVASAAATLDAAERAAARAERLLNAGVAPRKDLELANAELASARAAAANANRLKQLSSLVSPIDGVVTQMTAVLGANVAEGQALVEVIDTQALDVQLNVSPTAASRIAAGQAVTMFQGTSSEAEPIATGVVAAVSGVLDSASRGVLVRVSVQKQQRALRIGESVSARLVIATHTQVVIIPDGALVPADAGFQVFVVDGTSHAHAQAVTIGGRDGHKVWIADGLNAGDRVVVDGAFGVIDGAALVTGKRKP